MWSFKNIKFDRLGVDGHLDKEVRRTENFTGDKVSKNNFVAMKGERYTALTRHDESGSKSRRDLIP